MSAPLTITFAQAKATDACEQSYRKMARHLGGITKYGAGTPVPIETILDVCGMEDALWALSAIRDAKTPRLWACDCAERVLPIFESDRPGDLRPRDAIRASRRYARGEIGAAARDAAEVAAWAAAWAAAAARDAAEVAAWDVAGDVWGAAAGAAAGGAAWDAAGDAARAAAGDAARAAARAAAGAAARDAAGNAAGAAAWAAAGAAARDAARAKYSRWLVVRLESGY